MATTTIYRNQVTRGMTVAERIAYHTNRPSPDACWEWTASRNSGGYGKIRMPDRSTKIVPRIVWSLENGPIPEGGVICHHCDNPPCCNPRHLYCGTYASNMADRSHRGRVNAVVGPKHGLAKLTEEQAREILRSSARGVDLARAFGVSEYAISKVRTRKSWRYLTAD